MYQRERGGVRGVRVCVRERRKVGRGGGGVKSVWVAEWRHNLSGYNWPAARRNKLVFPLSPDRETLPLPLSLHPACHCFLTHRAELINCLTTHTHTDTLTHTHTHTHTDTHTHTLTHRHTHTH